MKIPSQSREELYLPIYRKIDHYNRICFCLGCQINTDTQSTNYFEYSANTEFASFHHQICFQNLVYRLQVLLKFPKKLMYIKHLKRLLKVNNVTLIESNHRMNHRVSYVTLTKGNSVLLKLTLTSLGIIRTCKKSFCSSVFQNSHLVQCRSYRHHYLDLQGNT